MRTSFRAALTDWKCVVQKSGCSTMIEAPCFNEAYNMCACFAGNARHVRNGTSQADKTKQAVVNGKTQAVFSRNSSRCPVFFCTKAPTNHLFAKCIGEEQRTGISRSNKTSECEQECEAETPAEKQSKSARRQPHRHTQTSLKKKF